MRKSQHQHLSLNLNVRGLTPSSTLAISEKCRELEKLGRQVFKLGLGQSPFPVPSHVVESLRKNAHQKDYLPVKGLPGLREAISDWNLRTQKVVTHPDHILIGPGSKELIFILQLVYYGDLIIPTPSWVSYSPQAQIIGRPVHWVPTHENNFWRLSYEELEELCQKDPDRPRLMILNYPSNPTGYTYPIERLKLLAQVARKYQVIVVSDEIYGMLHHQGQHVSIARYYPEGTIISNGISKWCGAGGWRLGTFSFPKELDWILSAMAVAASETYTSTSAPIQYAAITAFLESSEMDQYVLNCRKVLKAIAKKLTGMLHKMGLNTPLPQGGFYLFPNFSIFREHFHQQAIFTSSDMCRRLLTDTGVAMLPGSDFGRPQDEFTARLAYVHLDGARALEACQSLLNDNGTMLPGLRSLHPILSKHSGD